MCNCFQEKAKEIKDAHTRAKLHKTEIIDLYFPEINGVGYASFKIKLKNRKNERSGWTSMKYCPFCGKKFINKKEG